MNSFIKKTDKFIDLVNKSIESLKEHDLVKAYEYIVMALCEDSNAPEPHNLLGLWYEMKKNYDLARKHYRAAYALDPTYKPASINLERVCTMFINKAIPYEYGESNQTNLSNENILEKN